ncbi:hypothetical protein HOF92_16305 [bacterium]|nr:hypothetical protein [bacterium]
MNEFAPRRLDSYGEVDGFFMKARSPSCGIFDTRYFSDEQAEKEVGQGPGAFTSHALKLYPELPFADESLLKINRFRENFLTALFASARIRTYPGNLEDFHNEYQLLILIRNPKILGLLEQLLKVGNHLYYTKLCLLTLRQSPDPGSCAEIDRALKARSGPPSSFPTEIQRYLDPYPCDLRP